MSKMDVLWIDRSHAKLFEVEGERVELRSLEAERAEHHTHAPNGRDRTALESKLFQEIVAALRAGQADRILIVGPGVARHHFLVFLREHHPALHRKVAGCEPMDHPTDPQIAAIARGFASKQGGTPAGSTRGAWG